MFGYALMNIEGLFLSRGERWLPVAKYAKVFCAEDAYIQLRYHIARGTDCSLVEVRKPEGHEYEPEDTRGLTSFAACTA